MGHALLEEVIRKVRQQKRVEQIKLAVGSNNPTQSLYKSCGFQFYGCEKEAMKIGDQYVDMDLLFLK